MRCSTVWTIAPIYNGLLWRAFSAVTYPQHQRAGQWLRNLHQRWRNCRLLTPGAGVNGSGGSNRFGLVPRNFFKQPPIKYLDLRLSRRFAIGEKAKVEVLRKR